MMNLNTLLENLKNNGYKITEPRKLILEILVESNKKMLSVDTIFKKAKLIYNNINITTIYRNLEILDSLNIVHRILSSDGLYFYKLICQSEHHHHLICLNCGLIEIIDFCPLEEYIRISNEKKFQLENHKLELYGFCEKCTQKK